MITCKPGSKSQACHSCNEPLVQHLPIAPTCRHDASGPQAVWFQLSCRCSHCLLPICCLLQVLAEPQMRSRVEIEQMLLDGHYVDDACAMIEVRI